MSQRTWHLTGTPVLNPLGALTQLAPRNCRRVVQGSLAATSTEYAGNNDNGTGLDSGAQNPWEEPEKFDAGAMALGL